MQFSLEIRFVATSSQARRYVPKRYVRVLGLVDNQLETGSVPYLLGKIFGVVEVLVDVRFQAVRSLCTGQNTRTTN